MADSGILCEEVGNVVPHLTQIAASVEFSNPQLLHFNNYSPMRDSISYSDIL